MKHTINEVPPSSVVLDHLTLQSAFDLLSERGEDELPFESLQNRLTHERKWNYSLNNDFKITIGIACLAQLVQAIVLHDHIVINSNFISQWTEVIQQPNKGALLPLPTKFDPLSSLVNQVALDPETEVSLLENSMHRAMNYSRSEAFRKYLGVLAEQGVEGAILDITNGYFKTGYSDPSVLTPVRFEPIHQHDREMLRQALEIMMESPPSNEEEGEKWADILATLAAAGDMAHYFISGKQLDSDSRSYDDHVLTGMRFGDAHEKLSAARDVTKNAASAFYYQEFANRVSAAYVPHPLRVPFSLFDAIANIPSETSLQQWAIELGHAYRELNATRLGERFGLQVVEVFVPFVLAQVLKEARSPEEIIHTALSIRERKQARLLRAWFGQLHRDLQLGRTTIAELDSVLGDLSVLMTRWQETAPDPGPGRKVTLGVNVGFASFATDFDLKRGKLPRRYHRQLRFLQQLNQTGATTSQLYLPLKKVFGEQVAASWRRGQTSLVRFRQDLGTKSKYKCLLDQKKFR